MIYFMMRKSWESGAFLRDSTAYILLINIDRLLNKKQSNIWCKHGLRKPPMHTDTLNVGSKEEKQAQIILFTMIVA